jgi:predicted dehydrogenase
MGRLRIGVIGLGWFGEIHAETIAGVPNLELAALCTRTPDRRQCQTNCLAESVAVVSLSHEQPVPIF